MVDIAANVNRRKYHGLIYPVQIANLHLRSSHHGRTLHHRNEIGTTSHGKTRQSNLVPKPLHATKCRALWAPRCSPSLSDRMRYQSLDFATIPTSRSNCCGGNFLQVFPLSLSSSDVPQLFHPRFHQEAIGDRPSTDPNRAGRIPQLGFAIRFPQHNSIYARNSTDPIYPRGPSRSWDRLYHKPVHFWNSLFVRTISPLLEKGYFDSYIIVDSNGVLFARESVSPILPLGPGSGPAGSALPDHLPQPPQAPSPETHSR